MTTSISAKSYSTNYLRARAGFARNVVKALTCALFATVVIAQPGSAQHKKSAASTHKYYSRTLTNFAAFQPERAVKWTFPSKQPDKQRFKLVMRPAKAASLMTDEGDKQRFKLSTRPAPKLVIFGRAAWICTPSGFGRRATCASRKSYS